MKKYLVLSVFLTLLFLALPSSVFSKEKGCYCAKADKIEFKIDEMDPDKCVGITLMGIPAESVNCYFDEGGEDAPPPPAGTKKNGEACAANAECLSTFCSGGKCVEIDVSCKSDTTCQSGYYCAPGGKCQSKKNLGITCDYSNECASNYCEKTGTDGLLDRCAEKITKSAGTGKVGDACKSGNDCASGRCDYTNQKCLPDLNKCKTHEDCQKNEYCLDYLCKAKVEKGGVCTGDDGVFEGCVTGWCCKMRCAEKECPKDGFTNDTIPEATMTLPSVAGLNHLEVDSVPALIGNIIAKLMGVMGSIALAMFIYGGVLWMIAAGNAERSKKGMQIIVWSALGVMVILASYVIVSFVFEAFK